VKNTKEIAKQVHRTRALGVLDTAGAFKWLAHKPEILDELGKIDADYALLQIAKRVCELRPSTADAVAMVRNHREFDQLADEIVHCVRDYCKRKRSATRNEIIAALQNAAVVLAQVAEPSEAGKHQFLRNINPGTPVVARKLRATAQTADS
jgi:hypothetical protein